MNEQLVDAFSDFHAAVTSFNPLRDVFRGVGDSSFELVPKIGRPSAHLRGELVSTEQSLVRLFRERSLPYLSRLPKNDWEWLAVAQHHGLATRLLDWTRNPLVAAYFAVEEDRGTDAAVYVLKDQAFVDTTKFPDPFAYPVVGKFIPPAISDRINAQSSVFTIHPEPTAPMSGASIVKLVIATRFRRELRHMLYRYGVSRATIYPGLDGLAYHLNWLQRKRSAA